jgi:RsiW-degrading membrane proteinase PrsW (M82 family)
VAGLSVIGLTSVVSVLLVALETAMDGQWSSLWRGVVAIALVLIPALLWLAVFFREDALEPEPHQYVVGVFVLGVIAGGGLVTPVLRALDLTTWVQAETWSGGLGSVVQGVVLAGIIWLGVRLTVFPTAEFDERIDGMIYAIAMALGVATADGLALVLASDMRGLAALSATVTVDTLLMVAIGMVVGFALGGLKPGQMPGFTVAIALVGSGVLWWFHDVLRVVIVLDSLRLSSIRQLLPGLLVALGVLATFAWLMRQGRITHTADVSQAAYQRGDWWAIGVLTGVIILAMGIHGQPGGDDRVVIHGPLQLVVPQQSFPERIGEVFPLRTVTGVRYDAFSESTTATLSQKTAQMNLQRGAQCVSLNAGAEQYVTIGQNEGVIQEYVCLPGPGERDATYGYELLLIDEQTLYGVRLEGNARKASELEQSWQALLGSVQP